jgi:hypothetical protein
MAIYEGARPRARTFGGARPAYPAYPDRPVTSGGLARRRRRSAQRTGRLRLSVGSVLGAIVLLFVLAFFSLTQTVRLTASNYETDRLAIERERLQARQRELQADLARLGSEPAIRKLAFDAGLGQLDAAIVLPAR